MGDHCNRRILVVDDNPAIHEDFRKILRGGAEGSAFEKLSAGFFGENLPDQRVASFELHSAFQGEEGLEMVKKAQAEGRPYGVAFVDVRMPPGWDGIETTAKLWEVCLDLQVVLCTAYTDYGWEAITAKLGKTDRLLILKKPFDPVEVLQLAETLSRKWTLTQQARLRLADMDAMVAQRTEELQVSNASLSREIGARGRAEVLLTAFAELGSLLSAARTVRAAGQIIIDAAARLLGWEACLVQLYSPVSDLLTHVLGVEAKGGQRNEFIPRSEKARPLGVARKALERGGLLVRDLEGLPAEEQPFGPGNETSGPLMLVPIRNGKDAIGLVALQGAAGSVYDPPSLETLQALADHCGGALDRIRTEESLRGAQEDLRRSQKLEAVGQLAAGIAHDFNNLLAVIRGNADLARMGAEGLSPETSECLGQIVAASDRAANLTRQLLAFSRKQMMQSEPVDLAAVILNLSQMLKRLIGENIDLRCHYAPALPPVQADTGMLEQVLVNLVINARDAMPEGGHLLITTELAALGPEAVLAHPEARPGHFVCMTVVDNGSGIPAELLPRIFDPFFTTKEAGKGTGLGLATVYGIIKQHQGWTEVSSTVGVGTKFRILLPALESTRVAVPGGAAEVMKPPCGTETVLVVEDEKGVRAITRLILEHFGYRVLEAASGPEALQVWEAVSAQVDLLLTDVVMPEGVNGRKLAEKLQSKKPSLKVIFQSGYGGEVMGKRDDSQRETSGYFLQKPCPPRELLYAVRRCLDGLPLQRDHGPSSS